MNLISLIKKYLGHDQYPSWGAGVIGLIGSTIGNYYGVIGIISGGIIGLFLGHILGVFFHPEIIRSENSKSIAKKKMLQDFDNSAIMFQLNYETVVNELNRRYEILKNKERIKRITPINAEITIHIPSIDRRIHAKDSQFRQDKDLVESAKSLIQKLDRPIIVNCSRIGLGVLAVLNSLKVNYGIPFQIDNGDSYGVSQVKTVSTDKKRAVDFLITPEAAFLLASGNILDDYYTEN